MRCCSVCGKATKDKRRTCSDICLTIIKSNNGKATISVNRPVGEDHYLWKGGASHRKEWKREYKEKYPERYKAHRWVTDSVRRGKIFRRPCSVCGSEKSEAHHEDYDRPTEIIWLCRFHHREADKKLGIGSKDF